jgi:hypothetical protein
MIALDAILRRLVEDFEVMGLRWALVGGLAVSARAEPRTTRDVDVAVAVEDDAGAEQAVLALRRRGYRDAGQMLEQQATGRLATMRVVSPLRLDETAVVDLIFASTGIEPEIVAEATPVEVLPGTTIPVATLAHLLAMKVLAGRMQDLADFSSLFRHASSSDLAQARTALELIRERQSHRQKDLLFDFERLCSAAQGEA